MMKWNISLFVLLLLLILLNVQNALKLKHDLGGAFKKTLVSLPIAFTSILPTPIAGRNKVEPIAITKPFRLRDRLPRPDTATSPYRQRDSPSSESLRGSQFVRNAVRNVGPSVVRIDCEREVSQIMTLFNDHLREGDVMRVSGTGIVLSTDGYIITNHHVIDQSKKVTITLANGRSFKASVIAYDEFTDLAVIKADVSREKDFKLVAAPVGDSASLLAGDWVIAVGCPVGLDFTVTLGVVSSPRRSAFEVGAPMLKGSYIQTDAALNSGNSGGPLVNDIGEVVGINTMVRLNTEAIGFAIPINRARQIYDILKQGRKPSHAYFGIEVASITPDNARINNEDPNTQHIPVVHGAQVLKVVPGSPAEKCGLRRNDVIMEVNGSPVRNADDAEALLDVCKPGKTSQILVVRGADTSNVELEATPLDLLQLVEERKRLQPPLVVIKPPLPLR